MKASTLVLMLGTLAVSFTGLGATTSDLTDNSTAELVQMDDSVIVVTTQEVEAIQFNLVDNVSDLVMDSNIQTSISYAIFSIKANALLDQFNDEPSETILDVGWSNDRNHFTTTKTDTARDPGGVLSMFYI